MDDNSVRVGDGHVYRDGGGGGRGGSGNIMVLLEVMVRVGRSGVCDGASAGVVLFNGGARVDSLIMNMFSVVAVLVLLIKTAVAWMA